MSGVYHYYSGEEEEEEGGGRIEEAERGPSSSSTTAAAAGTNKSLLAMAFLLIALTLAVAVAALASSLLLLLRGEGDAAAAAEGAEAPEWELRDCGPWRPAGPGIDGASAYEVVAADGEGGFCLVRDGSLRGSRADTYNLSVSFKEEEDGGRFGIMYNYLDNRSHEVFYVFTQPNAAAGRCISLARGRQNSRGTVVRGLPYSPWDWNTLEAAVSEGRSAVEISLNGEVVAECPSSDLKMARGGLMLSGGRFHIRDIVIEVP